MSQPTVTSFFATRKRQASEDLRGKAKALILDRSISNEVSKAPKSPSSLSLSPKLVFCDQKADQKLEKLAAVSRSLFEAKTCQMSSRTPRCSRPRARARKASEDQQDIRESFQKMETKNVLFEKRGLLSPRKAHPSPGKASPGPGKTGGPGDRMTSPGAASPGPGARMTSPAPRDSESTLAEDIPAAGSTTPKKSLLSRVGRSEMSLRDIKDKINRSSRLAELKASIDRIKKCEQKLEGLRRKSGSEDGPGGSVGPDQAPKIEKFGKIELEVPSSPRKSSPMKTPTKSRFESRFIAGVSPQRRLLFEPKEKTPSPVKSSPTKAPAYQRYQSIVDSAAPALPLPFEYRFLGEVFRCVDTVAAMLFNRKETVTFGKLKPAVQELLRRNFTMDHLAQIQSVFPEGFGLSHEKVRRFEGKGERFELVLTPKVEGKSGRNTPDGEDVVKRADDSSMAPAVLLERRRKFYNALLDRVKEEHEKFLLNLEKPLVIPREKITRWHPEFDVECCGKIAKAELPQAPNVEKATSAHDVLEKAKSLFNCNTRMEKALQRLAEAKMTSGSEDPSGLKEGQISSPNVEVSGLDTPPATPRVERKAPLNPALKGIPTSLLEKIRAKQAAKALEAMTRTPDADKEATLYARLPEVSKILRNIFVAEKKGVLALEFVILKLDNSYRTKLTSGELEEHIRLMCKLLPTWASLHNVRKTNYLKISKDVDIAKVVKRFEILANDKVKG